MDRDKVTFQMDLDFSFSSVETSPTCFENYLASAHTSAEVVFIQDFFAKREDEKQAKLYNQIASEVSHLY